jgi:hypothetical protein
MINWNVFPTHILPRLQSHNLMKDLRRQPRLVTDTSDFTNIDCGDVIFVDNRYFLVAGYTKEGRFGIDDQPKQWVPKVVDLENGEGQILKLVFHENFTLTSPPSRHLAGSSSPLKSVGSALSMVFAERRQAFTHAP